VRGLPDSYEIPKHLRCHDSVGVRVWVTPASAQDPAVVNAKTIQVRFENERVRVLEATLPPGVKSKSTRIPAYVIYVLAGGRYRNYASDGKITEGTLQNRRSSLSRTVDSRRGEHRRHAAARVRVADDGGGLSPMFSAA